MSHKPFAECIGHHSLLRWRTLWSVDQLCGWVLRPTCPSVRFGVRPLPKRQMVLKLKEIFQYTHQTLDSDSEDESQSSQPLLQAPRCQTLASQTYKPSKAGAHAQQEATTGPGAHRPKGPAKTKGPQYQRNHHESIAPAPPSRSPTKEAPPGLDDDAQLPVSQESVATSVDGSDSSLSSQR